MSSTTTTTILHLLSHTIPLLLHLILICTVTEASPAVLTLPLTQLHITTTSNSQPQSPSFPYSTFTHLAASSTSRARHLKNPKPTTTTPLSPHSYGGYSISLQFGTPPQSIPLILDTGSNFVWFPCTHTYICKNCSFPPYHSATHFIPKDSSTARILGCSNPKCGWIHINHPNLKSRCKDCIQSLTSILPNSNNCTQICPPYIILYGSGSTGGLALTETLHFPKTKSNFPQFLVGCSLFSSHLPSGIAGFGRGLSSLPTQLNLARFSYSLISNTFDNNQTRKPGSLTLIPTGSHLDSDRKTHGVKYTPFNQNPILPSTNLPFSTYYYIGLRKITIGGARVKLPNRFLSSDKSGSGGTIVDSGTTLTYMTKVLFHPFAREFQRQVKLLNNGYVRNRRVEEVTGLRPCFNVTVEKRMKVMFPEMKLQFKGGMKVNLPIENYVGVVNGAACLMVVTDDGVEVEEKNVGPAVILGNFQMQGFYVEFDLRNQRFGLKKEDIHGVKSF